MFFCVKFLQEARVKWDEYEAIATTLLKWLKGAMELMLDRNFARTYVELKVCSNAYIWHVNLF